MLENGVSLTDIATLIDKELQASRDERQERFHSPFEGWGVLIEEWDELAEEIARLTDEIADVWEDIKSDNCSESIAIEQACLSSMTMIQEAVQVGAMLVKLAECMQDFKSKTKID